MTRLVIVVDVEEVDPTYIDPEELAGNVVAVWDEDRLHSRDGGEEIRLVSAEWES